MNSKTNGGGRIASGFRAVKRKATGLIEYVEIRQTPRGPMEIPMTKDDFIAAGGIDPEDPSVIGVPHADPIKAERITEYAVMEVGAYNLSGNWFPTIEAAEEAIKAQLGPASPLFQVVEVTYDDLEPHKHHLLADAWKLRLEEADALAAEEAAGVEALCGKKHPGKAIKDLTHDERVALANEYHEGVE